MLKVTIPRGEFYNESNGTFLYTDEVTLTLEHSLISMSEWESKWHKPFLFSLSELSREEDLDYIRCMTVTPKSVNPLVYEAIPSKVIDKIRDYINDPMTATTFRDDNKGGRNSKRIITSEVIYYQMTELNIPFTCEKWHLNRLLTLIRVCSSYRAPQKKMSRKDILNSNYALNQARRAKNNTRG